MDREQLLDEAVTAYLLAVEAGSQPNHTDWLARYPDLADDLAEFFAGESRVARSAVPLRLLAGTPNRPGDTVGLPPLPQPSGWSPAVRSFADFELLEEVGRGGMGVVYKARQVSLNRVVALKMILAGEHAGPAHRARFRTEAEAIARLEHANIVRIHEVGEHEGLPFLSLEFCPGGSLEKKLSGTPLPPEEGAALVERLAAAMHAAHQKGVIHRDLKPANILLGEDGTPKITDFGLARKLEAEPGALATGVTQTGVVMGTPSYMAPEQAEGKSKEMGPACDVYALGAILYECLTGRPPFRATTRLDTILEVIHREPVPPSRLQSKVPRDLETICLKCLHKEPGRRYETAADLAADLGRFRAGEPINARPVGQLERVAKWGRRNKGMALALASAAALLLVLVAGSLSAAIYFQKMEQEQRSLAQKNERLASENEDEKNRAVAAGKEAEAARQREVERSQQLQNQLYLSQMNVAGNVARSTGGLARVNEMLEKWRPKGEEPDPRGWEWYYLRGLARETGLILARHTQYVASVSWSPDGRRLASGSADGTVKIWNPVTGRQLVTLYGHRGGIITSLAWSPDGRRLASAGYSDELIRVWDTDTWQEVATLGKAAVFRLSWAPDSRRLVSAQSNQIRVWDAETGRQIRLRESPVHSIQAVTWSPDGTRIAVAGDGPRILLWNVEANRDTMLSSGHKAFIQSLAWDTTNRLLASSDEDGWLRLQDTHQEKEIAAWRGHSGQVRELRWSPDGRSLASGGIDQEVRIWDRDTRQEVAVLRGHSAAIYGLTWAPDSRRLATAGIDWTVRVWNLDASRERQELRGHEGAVLAAAWSPDGRHLASGGRDRTVRVWDPGTGKQIACLEGCEHEVNCLSWAPDGRRLAAGCDVSGTVYLWDVGAATSKTLRLPGVRALGWSPDGRRLAGTGITNVVQMWDTASGQSLDTLKGLSDYLVSLAWSPHGQRLAGGAIDGALGIWTFGTDGQRTEWRGHRGGVSSVCWSLDGERLASAGGDQSIKVWDARSRRELVRLRGHSNVFEISWSPDGTRLASAGGEGTVKVWDLATGQENLTLPGHTGEVRSVNWNRDGRRLASAGADGIIRIWDATPGFAAERSPLLLPDLDRRLEAKPESVSERLLRAEIRSRLKDWNGAAADWTQAAREQGALWFVAGWWVAGPYPANQPDPDTEASWREVVPTADGSLDLRSLNPDGKNGALSVRLRVYSPAEQSIAGLFSHSGNLRISLTGAGACELKAPPSTPVPDDAVPLTLRKGWNTLQIRTDLGTAADRLSVWLSADAPDRARALFDRGQVKEAEAVVAEALARRPEEPADLLWAARFHRRQPAATSRAREYYEKLLALRPQHAGYAIEFAAFLFGQAKSAQQAGRDEEAHRDHEQAVALAARFPGSATLRFLGAQLAPPWKRNTPIVTVKKELYKKHPEPRVAPWTSLHYVGPKLELREIQGIERRSDVGEKIQARWSEDNGRTWSEFKPVRTSTEVKYAGVTVSEAEGPATFDPASGLLIQTWLRQLEVKGVCHNFTYWRTSADGGRTWSQPEQLRYEDGDLFDPKEPLKAAALDRNEAYFGNNILIRSDGALVTCLALANTSGDPENNRRFERLGSVLLVGKWHRDRKTYEWTAGARVSIDADSSARGLLEPEVAELKDGLLLVVWRGSNRSWHGKPAKLPGRKFFSLSRDGGRTLSAPAVWGYDDGSSFYSPSSYHRMFRHSVTGKLYWLGNISATPPQGNLPRYPLVIAEVDETRAALRKATVTAIDDRQAGQGDIQFSNFSVYEDRQTHNVVLYLTTYGQEPDPKDWATADCYRYVLTLKGGP
jgi:WD40 repeat protein